MNITDYKVVIFLGIFGRDINTQLSTGIIIFLNDQSDSVVNSTRAYTAVEPMILSTTTPRMLLSLIAPVRY